MSPRKSRLPDMALGLGYGALIIALLLVALAAYQQAFTPKTEVTLLTGKLGNSLKVGSDVKLNDVPIGRVSEVKSADDGAVLTLALKPDVAKEIPQDTLARLLPKTLFGERFVALQLGNSSQTLRDGDQLQEDRSAAAVELQEVFDEMLPMLRAIKPDRLNAALSQVAAMLRGQGEDLGTMMATWGDYFEEFNPLVDEMTSSLAKFADVADVYSDAAPDLLDAFDSMATTSAMLTDKEGTLDEVFTAVSTSADTAEAWTTDHKKTITVLSATSRKALEAVRPYAKTFPCLLASAEEFIPEMETVLGKGTDEPGLHARLSIVPVRTKYIAGKDTPTFPTNGKAKCPYVPSSRKATARTSVDTTPSARAEATTQTEKNPTRTAPPPRRFDQAQLDAAAGLGEANSPSENRLIAQLVAPTLDIEPQAYPQWASLLVGPVLRGAEVRLK